MLGSTGSIGVNTLAVLEAMRDEWEVVALAAGSRGATLGEQANRFRPQAVALADEGAASALADGLTYPCRVFSGSEGSINLIESVECDCVVCAVVGTAALPATLRAAELGLRVALANKEALVVAGSVLMPLAQRSGAEILPIDSEHSGVFHTIRTGRRCDVRKVYLTSSGGPFRTWSLERMSEVTPQEALNHPTWEMGPKITIDSATMMNKALEVVEARWLFDLDVDQIGVVVHPESIIHSLVEFVDGSMVAQLSTPDMRTPIQNALTHPERRPCLSQPLDLSQAVQFNLQPPDQGRFPALRLGYEVASLGGTSGAVLNAADEAAVEMFRSGEISFLDIVRCCEETLMRHECKPSPTLEDLLEADRWAREEVTRCMPC